jgi:putative membrane protein
VLFVVIVVAVVKWLWGSKMPFLMYDRENALEVLKKRYAKGEIGKEEYERIKRDIE